jgi:Transposase
MARDSSFCLGSARPLVSPGVTRRPSRARTVARDPESASCKAGPRRAVLPLEAPMTAPAVFVGIDVAKATLDVVVRPSGACWQLPNEDAAIKTLVARLAALPPTLLVLEATGGFERAIVAALAGAGLPVVVANPRQVRDFARATGQLAKTDAIDAAVLALFAERVRPEPRPLPDTAAQALDALLTRRRQLLEMLVAEKNRLGLARSPIRRGITQHIRWLERQLADVDGELGRLIEQSPVWRAKDDLLQSVPGVGPVLSRTLLGELPSWASSIASRSLPWWASPRSPAIAARCGGAASSGAAGRRSAPCCTWARWSRPATIPSSGASIGDCGRPANRRKWRSRRACGSCSRS